MRIVRVRKSELPLPLVVEGENGGFAVLSLEAAGKKRLGARLGAASKWVVERVTKLLAKCQNKMR